MTTIQLATDYNYYRPEIRAIQNQPEITVHHIGQRSGLQYSTNPNITRIFQTYKTFTLTDLVEINTRFTRAAYYAAQYDYGVFLLQEEVWHPSLQVSWGQRKLTDWTIEGTLLLPNGTVLELLKNWYIRTKGEWTPTVQAWWDTVKASNNPWESTVKAWSAYYGYTLLKAWHEHMRSLGKKSAMMGLCGFSETSANFRNSVKNNYYPGEMFNYFIQNYDLQTTGIHPTTMAKIPDDILWLKVLRDEWGYKGKIVHFLPVCWSDKWGCPWNEAVAKEDFRQAAPYADIMMALPFADISEWMIPTADIPKHIQYIPIVIEWMKELPTPTPAPTPVPTPTPTLTPGPTPAPGVVGVFEFKGAAVGTPIVVLDLSALIMKQAADYHFEMNDLIIRNTSSWKVYFAMEIKLFEGILQSCPDFGYVFDGMDRTATKNVRVKTLALGESGTYDADFYQPLGIVGMHTVCLLVHGTWTKAEIDSEILPITG